MYDPEKAKAVDNRLDSMAIAWVVCDRDGAAPGEWKKALEQRTRQKQANAPFYLRKK
jgi:ferric-dicitrate binding protein FerR (iron transport regulator)